jgi:hypothetical protein
VWGSYVLDLDLDIGVVHVEERSLVDLDLARGVVHVGGGRFAKIYQTWLVKLAKMGGGEWGNELGREEGRV